jgi:hypothetical protein
MLKWSIEKLKLLPLWGSKSGEPPFHYRRAGLYSQVGDAATDAGALALLEPAVARKHFEASQLPSGRLLRHSDRLNEYLRADAIGKLDERYSYSRDHSISLCWYSLWSGDTSIARKFLWWSIKGLGRFCPGTVGQGCHNPGSFAALLLASGFKLLGTLLYLVYLPWLLLTVGRSPAGYVLVLYSEHAIIMGKFSYIPWAWVRPILIKCYEKERCNMWYELWATGSLSTVSKVRLLKLWHNWVPAYGKGGWLFTYPTDGRRGTGIDLVYLLYLSGLMQRS